MRETNELGDLIVNEPLTIQELYDFAKENNTLDSTLYFVNKEEGGDMSDTVYASKVTHFGKGWGKNTVMIFTSYKKETHMDACSD